MPGHGRGGPRRRALIHDGSFRDEEAKRAVETGHATAREAATLARDAGVKLLALVHASSRYNVSDLVREAREVFPEAVAPRDFDLIEVPFPERGKPQLIQKGALSAGPTAAPSRSPASMLDERLARSLHVKSLRARDLHPEHEPHVLFQASTIGALLDGAYEGDVSFAQLGEHGDLGLGTFNALDGEMIALDGGFYRADVDGRVSEVTRRRSRPSRR